MIIFVIIKNRTNEVLTLFLRYILNLTYNWKKNYINHFLKKVETHFGRHFVNISICILLSLLGSFLPEEELLCENYSYFM